MGKALTDIAKFVYMATIAENDQWVWQPSVVELPIGKEGRIVKRGIGWLIEETERYQKMAEEVGTEEVKKRYEILQTTLDKAMEDTKNMPEDFVQLPTTKTYGPLAGAYVKKPIADDITPIMGAMQDKAKLWRTLVSVETQGMALFKIGKVALNFSPTALFET